MRRNNRLTIGYTCNVKRPEIADDERYSEWESPETIEAVTKALEKTGNHVILIDADTDIYHKLLRYSQEIDIVFNNAEGLEEGEIREAIVPFFCELIRIPYSGSGPQTMINTLDKATTKEILKNYGINTPLFQEFEGYTQRLEETLRFPLMVKPITGGTSMGISNGSKVTNNGELFERVREIIETYRQPALVEEFLPGKECTVGIIGSYILPIVEIDHSKIPGGPDFRDTHTKDVDYEYNGYFRLFPFGDERYVDMARQAAIAFEALSCDDYCRVDFREGTNGKFYFIEMNPLPGIHPTHSDLSIMARFAGIEHYEMVNMTLHEAIKRNKKNPRYTHMFGEGKTEGIIELCREVETRLGCYGKKIEGEDYRLVKENGLRI